MSALQQTENNAAKCGLLSNDHTLPLVIEPQSDTSINGLKHWISDNHNWLQRQLKTNGALLFRGFDVTSPESFEKVALAVEPNLQKTYLGTSPRNALTPHVFTASELPGFYPVPQHCEMSYLKDSPKRLFFGCLHPPKTGGETPLVDVRKVAEQLDPEVKQAFESGGIKIYRNYCGPQQSSRFQLWQLKRWEDMFQTTDKDAVEAECKKNQLDYQWFGNDKLRLIDRQPAFQTHPETGKLSWYNHSLVFHLDSAPAEYKRIYQRRPSAQMWGLWQFARLAVAMKRWVTPSEAHAMHTTYLDGTEIPRSHMEHVRDIVWRNMVIFPWQQGDIVAIDNRSVSHGRLPYQDKRRLIVVSWA